MKSADGPRWLTIGLYVVAIPLGVLVFVVANKTIYWVWRSPEMVDGFNPVAWIPLGWRIGVISPICQGLLVPQLAIRTVASTVPSGRLGFAIVAMALILCVDGASAGYAITVADPQSATGLDAAFMLGFCLLSALYGVYRTWAEEQRWANLSVAQRADVDVG